MRAGLRDAVEILLVGVLVAASPIVWSHIAWSGEPAYSAGAWVLLFWISLPPFVLLSVFRGSTAMSRWGSFIALAGCVAFVVFGQVVGLNPNDPSSTAVVALLVVPIEAVLGLFVVFALDTLLRGIVLFVRGSERPRSAS